MSATRTMLPSFALRSLRSAVAAPRPSVQSVRSFQTSRILAAGKESALHNENRAEEAEAHKQDGLKKQKEGKGQWKDELASDSESIVKAEADKKSISEMQHETAKKAEQGKS